jgi:hypothetical protein
MPAPILVAFLAGVGLWAAHRTYRSRRRKVFVSYRHAEDRRYRDLLRAWDASEGVDFRFELTSPTAAINSSDAHYIKSRLRPRIVESDCLLVITGYDTAASDWVDWEVGVAAENDIPVVVVKTDRSHPAPPSAYGVGAKWVNGFTKDGILGAIRST